MRDGNPGEESAGELLAIEIGACQREFLLDLDSLPRPDGISWEKWLTSFPSHGYLLNIAPAHLSEVTDIFTNTSNTCAHIGSFTAEMGMRLSLGTQRAEIFA